VTAALVRSGGELLTAEVVAARCELHPDLVIRFVEVGIIEPCGPGLFAPEATLRVQRAVRLRRDLGINTNGVLVVLDLLERIDALEERLRAMERP
jgi:hypothetical protein